MARETTIQLNFLLQQPSPTALVLASPGVTKGATTTVHVASADPNWAANPATLFAGQMVHFAPNTTGWASLDNKIHVVTAVDDTGDTITLRTNTSAESTALRPYADIDAFTFAGYAHVCLTTFTVAPGTPGEVDATTMCDQVRVNLPGMPSPGTSSFTGMFDLEDPGMLAIMAAWNDGIPRFFVGETRRGQRFAFHGIVSAFSVGDLSVETPITFNGSFTLDGAPTYIAPVT